MLRSATKIIIQAKSYFNNKEILFAPIIDLFGLILRSDQPVPEAIKSFLQSLGAKINRIKIDNELFIMLQGKFNVTKFEVEQFIEQHKELVEKQKENIDAVAKATHMQQLFAKEHERILKLKSNITKYCNGEDIITIHQGLFNIGTNLALHSGKKTVLLGSNINVGNTSNILADQITFAGRKLNFPIYTHADSNDANKTKAGYMATHLSLHGSEFLFTHKLKFKNSLVDSGGIVKIASEQGHLELKFSREVDWKNNPYSSWQTFNKIKSDVTKLEFPCNESSLDDDVMPKAAKKPRLFV